MKCAVCNKNLTGRQSKFCSKKCKGKYGNNKYQNYKSQQKRGIERRNKLLEESGGKCCKCGYDKFIGALHFHHTNDDKEFGIDIRHCSNKTFDSLLKESKKCIVLCANCHAEEHYYNK